MASSSLEEMGMPAALPHEMWITTSSLKVMNMTTCLFMFSLYIYIDRKRERKREREGYQPAIFQGTGMATSSIKDMGRPAALLKTCG